MTTFTIHKNYLHYATPVMFKHYGGCFFVRNNNYLDYPHLVCKSLYYFATY